MFSDEPSVQGSHLPAPEGDSPPPLLFVAPESNPFLVGIPHATIISAPGDSLPATVTDLLSTTAPIHKVSRGALEPAGTGDTNNTETSRRTQLQTSPSCSTLSTSPSPSKITGVATIILPPHQNNSSHAVSSSSALCSQFTHPHNSPPVSSAPKLSPLLSSTSSTSTSPALPGSILTSHAVACSSSPDAKQPSPARGTTVIDLNLCCSTVPTDVNNNDIPANTTSCFDIPRTAVDTNINTCENDTTSLVNARANTICMNTNLGSVYNTASINPREEVERFISAPLNSLEEFLSDQLQFEFGKEIDREDVFADTNDSYDRYKCKCSGRKQFGSALKSEVDNSFYSSVPPPVLPPFLSVFKEQSPLSYPASISTYTNIAHHYHHSQSDNEEENMTTMPGLPSSGADIMMNMNPVFGLSRSDSGFCSDGPYNSRTNSSSSYCSSSSSSSVDMECDEPWGSDLAEERNYTDLTSVRSDCPGQELLPSILNEEEEEGSLQVLLSASGNVKSEPLEGYTGFSMAEFISHLKTSEFDSDGYSSSTDNEGPHYTQLEEASNLFSGSTIMGVFPPLPVLPTDQVKMPNTTAVPSHLGQPSPSSDQSDSERWIVAKENLPDFGKLQDPSTEEKEKPTPSRRHSLSSSPKEKKKTSRESPTLSEKSLSDRKKPGRKKGQVSNVLHLWEFMRDLLKDPRTKGDIIEWISEKDGVFRVVNSAEVAKLWGEKKKNKKEMTYEKMSRSLRYSRLEGYFSDLPKDKNYPKKLCFKFGPKSKDWF